VFRILSLDGGGIKGVFEASFLKAIQEKVTAPLASYFDLIAGTSTGGIIALGLGLGFGPNELLQFYRSYGRGIFQRPGNNWLGRKGNWLRDKLKHKYYSGYLRAALEATFKDKKLGNSANRLLIPAFNLSAGDIHVYKTRHHPKLQMDYKVSAVDVALATTAAPTYFPAHRSEQQMLLIDGGIWANNPTGLAVVEALTLLQIPANDIEVLSIGCTQEISDLTGSGSGELHWIRRAIDCALLGQSFGSIGTAAMFLGHQKILRISPPVNKGRFALDSIKGIDQLEALGYSEARKALPEIKIKFLTEPAEPFISAN
jgi:patatin-like phospholipase/acyl hydrolase